MATITKRKDGRWQAVVELPPDPKTGKRRRKWLYADSRSEVKRLANKLEDRIASGNFVEPSKLTVEGYLLQWLEDYCTNLSPTTLESYTVYIKKHIIPFLGNFKLQKLKPIDIQRFYNDEFEKGYSGTTVLHEHRLLHKALDDAMKNYLIERNPIDMVEAPKPNNFKPQIYDETNFNNLLKSISGTEDELPIILAGLLGLRRGEVFGLRWKDVNLEEKTITINQTLIYVDKQFIFKPPKSETSKRTISIPENIIPILKKYRAKCIEECMKNEQDYKEKLVCRKTDGSMINPRTFSNHFKDLLKKHKLPHIRFHDLRHFNATMMLEYGVETKIASKRLGHSTPAITQKIYQHVTEKMDKDAAEKLNRILQK
jgi:integrase